MVATRPESLLLLLATTRHLRAHPYPVVASALVAVVFVKRLVVHQSVFGRFPTLVSSATSTAAVFTFLLCWFLVLASMLVDREAMAR